MAEHEKATPKEMVPERDMKPMADDLDAILMDQALDASEQALGPQENVAADMPAAEMESESPMMDTKHIEEMLEVSPDRAALIFEAAQMMPKLSGKSPQDIAEMLQGDMQLRMQVEQMAARMEDSGRDDMPDMGGGSMMGSYGGPSMKHGAYGGGSMKGAYGGPGMKEGEGGPGMKDAKGGPGMMSAMTSAVRGFGAMAPVGKRTGKMAEMSAKERSKK